MALCECGCGQTTLLVVKNQTKAGHVKGQPMRFVRGHNPVNLKHGLARRGKVSPEYKAYLGAKRRCTNPKHKSYKDYGARGIKFLFVDLDELIFEVGLRPTPQHSLDRFPNNDGNYEPGNVRWATKSEQAINRRLTPAVLAQLKTASMSRVAALKKAKGTLQELQEELRD